MADDPQNDETTKSNEVPEPEVVNETENKRLDRGFMSVMSSKVVAKDIRQFLVELTKQRTLELLNIQSDLNRDNVTFTMVGTSLEQIRIVRAWLSTFVLPTVFNMLTPGELKEVVDSIFGEDEGEFSLATPVASPDQGDPIAE